MDPDKKEFTAQLVSYEETYKLCKNLADIITHSSHSFDAIVAIARGGFPPARFLCDFLNIEKLYSIQIKHYSKGAEKQEKAEILNKNLDNINNKKLLLVDDVNDSGKSLEVVYGVLDSAKLVKTAVMHEKDNTQFEADYKAKKLHEWKWLIYPWAVTEDVLEFLHKGDMLEKDLNAAKSFLKNNYGFEISEKLLESILNYRVNYFS